MENNLFMNPLDPEFFFRDLPFGDEEEHEFIFIDFLNYKIKVMDSRTNYIKFVAYSLKDNANLGILKNTRIVLHMPEKSFHIAYSQRLIHKDIRGDITAASGLNLYLKFKRITQKKMIITDMKIIDPRKKVSK